MRTSDMHAVPPVPTQKNPVRELLLLAGQDVRDWEQTQSGRQIANPNDNIGRNTNWSFPGKGGEPTVLCIWYKHIDWDTNPPRYRGNEYEYQRQIRDLAKKLHGQEANARLTTNIGRSSQLHNAVYNAKKSGATIKFILVDGETVTIEESAEKASTVSARELDRAPWFVHEIDGVSGDYLILRGVQPSPEERGDFEESVDPGSDPAFQAFVATLEDTEREAMIRARVGQGPFRDGLIDRWKGCSVTGCPLKEVLIASHIKPWSKCETSAERLGTANGLLLVPNLDKLFDKGLITFDDDYRIVFSPQLKEGFAQMLNVDRHMRLKSSAQDDIKPFLAWHRQYVFQG